MGSFGLLDSDWEMSLNPGGGGWVGGSRSPDSLIARFRHLQWLSAWWAALQPLLEAFTVSSLHHLKESPELEAGQEAGDVISFWQTDQALDSTHLCYVCSDCSLGLGSFQAISPFFKKWIFLPRKQPNRHACTEICEGVCDHTVTITTAEREARWKWLMKAKVFVAQSCPILFDPVDCSLPGSSVHGMLQARILGWLAISFSRGSSQIRD